MAFPGRWGFHACSRETFADIKEFHWLAYLDLRATRRRNRWLDKKPHNRSGAEPGATMGTDGEYYRWVLNGYRAARRPAPTAKTAKPLDLPSDWEIQLGAYQILYGAGDVGKLRQVPVAQTV